MADDLAAMFQRQADFQRFIGLDIDALVSDPEQVQARSDLARLYAFAAEAELHEAIDETSWKPWASGAWFKEEEFKRELVDVGCFWLNLCLLAGMTASELAERHEAKVGINVARQNVGYHAQAKCPQCEMELGTCNCAAL